MILKLRDSEPFQVKAHSHLYFGVRVQTSAPIYVIPKGTHPDGMCVKYIVLGGVVHITTPDTIYRNISDIRLCQLL